MNKMARVNKSFEEGKFAFSDGYRRGSNPYSAGLDQSACLAWWAGWDAANEESKSEIASAQDHAPRNDINQPDATQAAIVEKGKVTNV